MGFFLIMKAEIVRSFIITRRYWFRTMTGLVIGYGMLMVLIAGFTYSQQSVTEQLGRTVQDPTNFVLGFIIGMFAFGVVGMFTQGLQGMASTGVLEQLCMSPHGLVTNFLARSVVAAFSTVLSSGLMLWLVTFTLGGELYFEPIQALILLALTFTNLLGFGFMMGGLVLVFKQVGQVAILIRMSLFALAIFAKEELFEQGGLFAALLHLLPITDAAVLLKALLIEGHGVINLESIFVHPSFKFLILNCVIWTLIGITCFRVMEDWSRSRGTLGSY